MQRILSRSIAAASCLLTVAALQAARRPRYGGTLRIEVSRAIASLDPADVPSDPFEAALKDNILREIGPFRVAAWDPMKSVALEANDAFPAGRPYLDRVEIQMNRSARDQSLDFELGKADIVELPLPDVRRIQQQGARISESSPCLLLALVFESNRAGLDRIRQALALAIDRPAIRNVLLQKQGEISGALLPQWLSGYAFLFPSGRDLAKAKALGTPNTPVSLAWDARNPLLPPIAQRIIVDGAEAGVALRATTEPGGDVRLVALRIASDDAAEALRLLGGSRAGDPQHLYEAERALIDSHRLIPLFHIPVAYEMSLAVQAWSTSPVGNWRLEDVWLEAVKP